MIKRSVILPGLLTLIIAVSVLLFFSSFLNFNPTFFIFAGEHYSDSQNTPADLFVFSNTDGYDGQFYYRIALNPFTNQLTEYGITFDSPRYRHQRILYPVISWMLAMGNVKVVPYALILVNILALVSIAINGAKLARDYNHSPLWGCAFSLYIGLFLSLTNDLTEVTEIAFLMFGLLAVRRSSGLAAVFFTCAVLSKETALLVPLSLLLADLILKRIDIRKINWTYLIPILAFLVWQGYLALLWRNHLTPDITNNLGLPFIGLISFVKRIIVTGRFADISMILGIVILFILVSLTIGLKKTPLTMTVAWILYSILMLSLSDFIYSEIKAYMRAYTEWYIFSLIILLGNSYFKRDGKMNNDSLICSGHKKIEESTT